MRTVARTIKMNLQVDPKRCQRCDLCRLEVGCLSQVVERSKVSEAPVIDEGRCSGCGMCTLICPHDAVVQKMDNVGEPQD
jgi:MinD superfamily P-loop ATPase